MSTNITEVTVGGIKALVVADNSFGFGIGQRGPWRRVTYQVDGTDAANFCDALKGIGQFSFLPYGWPLPHRYPNNPALICQNVDGVPIGALQPDPQLMRGDLAHIAADYGFPEWDVYGDQGVVSLAGTPVPWSSFETRGSYQEYAIPNSTLVTVGGANPGTPIDEPYKKRVSITEYVFRRVMLPNLTEFDTLLDSIVGQLNDDVFFGKPRGTLVLESWDQSFTPDPQGFRVHEFSMLIRRRPYDWNMVPDPGTANDWVMTRDAASGTPLTYTSFLPLIQYGVI